jgi:hypothetical protein
MQRLKLNFNHLFSTITPTQKIQIYLIPLLVTFLIFSNNLFSFQEEPLPNISKIGENIEKKASKIEILSFYENLAKLTKSTIYTLQFDKKNQIHAEFGGDINCVIHFLQEIEKRDTILSLKMTQKAPYIIVEAIFLVQTYQNTNINLIVSSSHLTNPFLEPSETKSIQPPKEHQEEKGKQPSKINTKESIKKPIAENLEKEEPQETQPEESENYIEVLPKSKTVAIVGKYVLLNKEWLKIGDSYKGYTIVDISTKTIHFEKDGKLALMEMFDDN